MVDNKRSPLLNEGPALGRALLVGAVQQYFLLARPFRQAGATFAGECVRQVGRRRLCRGRVGVLYIFPRVRPLADLGQSLQ